MPAIVRKSFPNIVESRREILQTISWQVRSSVWSPPTDVYETEQQFVVRVEIAGMRDDNFEVAVENNVLRIAGQRPDHNERRAYHQMEIWFGSFEIAVELPVPVDVERSQAEYKDGFLMITLPKSQSKQIKVEE
jgi:HSP20 family protein